MRIVIAQQLARHLGQRALGWTSDGVSMGKMFLLVRVAADTFIVLMAVMISLTLRVSVDLVITPDLTLRALLPAVLERTDGPSVVALIGITLAIFYWSGFYTYGRLYQSRYKLVIVSQAVAIGFLVFATISFLFPFLVYLPRSVLVMSWALTWAGLVASRLWSSLWRALLAEEAAKTRPSPPGALPRKRSVLVIGGGGYIGSALLPKLLAQDCEVRVLDVLMYGVEPIAEALRHPSCELLRADFRHVDALVKAMRGVDEVVHLGGLVGDPACALDAELTIDINLAATRTVAEVAKGVGVRKFFFASTCSVYGANDEWVNERSQLNPVSLYARTKVVSEQVLLELADANFRPVIGRFATIFGISGRTRFDLVVNLLTAKALLDGEITVHGGEQWRPFIHVDDAARAIGLLLEQNLPDKSESLIFNIGSNAENYTIGQIADLVHAHVPQARLVASAPDGEKRNYRVQFDKISQMIGFRATRSVAEGIEEVASLIATGKVRDYRDPAYSNAVFLREFGSTHLERPRPRWAWELIDAPAASRLASL